MALQAGFAEIEITPPVGTHKIGWLKDIVSETILSPLYAHVALFRTPAVNGAAANQVVLVSLDTLFIAWPEVTAIRAGIAQQYGFPGNNILVAATHNHAGPAVTHAGDVPKDEAYARFLVSQVIAAFGQALANLEDAEIGRGRCFEWRVAHNRRVVMRDGTVRTHGTFDDSESLYLEGPVDPEVAVLGVRRKGGGLLGALVNYACHPTHHGGDAAIDAGFPGVLADRLRAWGCPVTLFLNGASGNLHTADPCHGGENMPAEQAGEILAGDVQRVLEEMAFSDEVPVGTAALAIDLPYRKLTDAEIEGRAYGAQRFIDPAIYDRAIPLLAEQIRRRGAHRAEIQVVSVGDCAVVGVPGEYFCEFGLQIKKAAYPLRAWVATCANGRVGYIPTAAAFRRGGYETTFGPSSMLSPEAGDMIAQAAIALIATQRPEK